MQATVASFDPATRTGVALRDDGRAVAITDAAFAASGLRLLRPGQRIRLDRDAAGAIWRVTLPTLDTGGTP
ncbi:cold-shock protein [Pilimelia anulata]|nr:cold-shock protein [Pilimelia anulata]